MTLMLWDDWQFTGSGLPFPGTIGEQPSWELDAFRVLSSEQSVIDSYEAEKQSRRAEMER